MAMDNIKEEEIDVARGFAVAVEQGVSGMVPTPGFTTCYLHLRDTSIFFKQRHLG